MIMRDGAGVFSPEKMASMEVLVREAGGDVYDTIGPILSEVWMDVHFGHASIHTAQLSRKMVAINGSY